MAAIFNVLKKLLGAYLGDLQYYKGRECKFRDSRELIGCCRLTNDAGKEVGMA